MHFLLWQTDPAAYADGVPQQDFPVKVASRSGQRSVTEKEVRP